MGLEALHKAWVERDSVEAVNARLRDELAEARAEIASLERMLREVQSLPRVGW